MYLKLHKVRCHADVGVRITLENMVAQMLEGKEMWEKTENLIVKIMQKKEVQLRGDDDTRSDPLSVPNGLEEGKKLFNSKL